MTEAEKIADRLAVRVTVDLVEAVKTIFESQGRDEEETDIGAITQSLLDSGLQKAVELIEQGIAFEYTSNDKVYLIMQATGHRDLLKQILAALKGEDV